MRTRNRRRMQSELNVAFADYNMKLKRKRTIFQRITRIVLTLCVLSFLSGVLVEVVNLTGLNLKSGVVSAHESTGEFNPVKTQKKVVVIIVTDEEDVKGLLEYAAKIKE